MEIVCPKCGKFLNMKCKNYTNKDLLVYTYTCSSEDETCNYIGYEIYDRHNDILKEVSKVELDKLLSSRYMNSKNKYCKNNLEGNIEICKGCKHLNYRNIVNYCYNYGSIYE